MKITRTTRRERAKACAICNGWVLTEKGQWVRTRDTKGMVCVACGWDYSKGEP